MRGQGWPGEFEPRTGEQWETFLSDYRDYILRFAEVADSMDVEMMSVGTEVDLVALARPDYWRALIAEVRAIYGGGSPTRRTGTSTGRSSSGTRSI